MNKIFEEVKEKMRLIDLISQSCMKWAEGYCRYETIRRLNPRQFKDLYDKCLLSGQHFDDAVDKLEV